MIKGRSVIGKPVLSRADGEKLAAVKDLVIGKDHTSVIALIIDEGGLFSKATVVPFENVVSFGKDVVMITDSQAAVRADKMPAVAEALETNRNLDGKKVFSETGEEHGRLDDVYFDEKSGSIVGVDVTELVQGNSPKSKAYLDVGDIISFGIDAVIISASAVDKLAAPDPNPADAGRSPSVTGGATDSSVGSATNGSMARVRASDPAADDATGPGGVDKS